MFPEVGRQRVGVLSRLPQVLREFGVDPDLVLAEAGVPRSVIDDPDGSLVFEDLDRLLLAATRTTQCPHVGLLVGRLSCLGLLGPVGELMRHAPTLRRALIDLAEHQLRYVRGSVVYFVDHGDCAMLGYVVDHPGFASEDQLVEGSIGAGAQFVRELSPSCDFEVLFSRRPPGDERVYQRVLDARVRFGQEQDALVLDGRLLDRPRPGADPDRRAALEDFIKTYWAIREPTTGHMVRRILHSLVLTSDANLAGVAARLNVHPRTLHRRLQQDGTSFRQILEEVRFGVARRLLARTAISITQLGLWLGYSEAAAFAHAFRRWAGTSAAEWRAARRPVRGTLAGSRRGRDYRDDPFVGAVRKDQDVAPAGTA
jgi:AraC-like DNA-binding protein